MLRCAEHHQLVLDPGLHFQIGMLAVTLDQTKIKFVLSDLMHDMRGVMDVQFDPAFRVTLHEVADQQRGEIVADGQRGAHRERAEPALAVQQILDGPRLIQQGDRLRQQLLAQRVQAEPLAGPVEQLAAGLPLQLGQ